jgi:hypothetical protein
MISKPSWCHPHSPPARLATSSQAHTPLHRGYALSSANGARSGPAYLCFETRSVGNSQVHSAAGEAPAHTFPRLSEPARRAYSSWSTSLVVPGTIRRVAASVNVPARPRCCGRPIGLVSCLNDGELMAAQLRTRIEIDAPAARVWDVLTNFAAYPEWNPFIVEWQGRVTTGATVRFRFQFIPGLPVWTEATILRVQPGRELRWAAHVLTPRLFNGERRIELTPIGESKTLFNHVEVFTGLVVVAPVIQPLLRLGWMSVPYRAMNSALKKRVEEHA